MFIWKKKIKKIQYKLYKFSSHYPELTDFYLIHLEAFRIFYRKKFKVKKNWDQELQKNY